MLHEKGKVATIHRIAKKQYQCIINFEIIKTYKQRRSCKNRIVKLYKNLI